MSKQKKRESQLLSHMALLPSPLPSLLCLEVTEGGAGAQPGAVGLGSTWARARPTVSQNRIVQCWPTLSVVSE